MIKEGLQLSTKPPFSLKGEVLEDDCYLEPYNIQILKKINSGINNLSYIKKFS